MWKSNQGPASLSLQAGLVLIPPATLNSLVYNFASSSPSPGSLHRIQPRRQVNHLKRLGIRNNSSLFLALWTAGRQTTPVSNSCNAGYFILQPSKSPSTHLLRGAIFVVQHLAARIRADGSILFTTLVSNQSGFSGMVTYSVFKAARRKVSRANTGIRVGNGTRKTLQFAPEFIKASTVRPYDRVC